MVNFEKESKAQVFQFSIVLIISDEKFICSRILPKRKELKFVRRTVEILTVGSSLTSFYSLLKFFDTEKMPKMKVRRNRNIFLKKLEAL